MKASLESIAEVLASKEALAIKEKKHYISVDDYSIGELNKIVALARTLKQKQSANPKSYPLDLLKSSHLALMFFENSTRTKCSFSIAAANLGAHPLDLNISSSSTNKGESIEDTATTLTQMGFDGIVIRHKEEGICRKLSKVIPDTVSVINAGEGRDSHPTQALLDYFTMLEYVPDVRNKKITIFGDTRFSRVARSNARLLTKAGARVRICSPENLLASDLEFLGVELYSDLNEAIKDSDFIMSLRVQFERQDESLQYDREEYIKKFQLTHSHLKLASNNVKVMHPGPVNRNLELTDKLVDDPEFSVIKQQVQNGVFVRMAILAILLN